MLVCVIIDLCDGFHIFLNVVPPCNLQVSSRDLVKKKLFILHYETTKILEHDNIHSRAACDNKISSTATAIPPQTINQDEFNVSLFIYLF